MNTTRTLITGASCFALLLALACDGGAEKPPAKAAAPAKAAPAKAPTKAGVHGANPHAAAGNPHAGMAKPSSAPELKDLYPNARELTPTGETRDEVIGELALKVPSEWTRGEPKSRMRLAEFKLPGPGGDVELAVFRFPGGGSVQANLDRWKGQLQGPDGAPVPEADQSITTIERAPYKITSLDTKGTYVAAVTPGSSARYNTPDARMFAVIIEGAGDPYFLKAVGPKKTVDIWEAAFKQLTESIKAKG